MTREARLEVKVTPRASADDVRVDAGIVRVRVTAAPTDGRANEAVVRTLAAALRVPTRDVRIVTGVTARRKVLAIAGVDERALELRLAEVPAQPIARRGR